MPGSALLRPAVALAALACAGMAFAQPGMGMGRGAAPKTFIAGSGPDDMWEITTKMQMQGMAIPGETQQVCIKKGKNVGEESVPKQDNCKVTEMRTVGNKTTFAMECTGEEPMSMRGETTATATSFDSRMSMKSTRRGGTEMTMTSSGRRTGACTDQSEQMMASLKAQGDAEVAKFCAEASDRFNFQSFGAGGPCEGRKKAFCDKVGGLAPGMNEIDGFRKAVFRPGPGLDAMRGSFQVCGLNFEATNKAVCGKAVGAKNYSFIGSGACDSDVLAIGKTECEGRTYYTINKAAVPTCNRYAQLTRGRGATAGAGGDGASPGQSSPGRQATSAQPAEPPKADPVKQGVDAVRRLLPF